MAVTQGHGNPDWTRDETILALNLYFECGRSGPDETDPRIVELSRILNTFPWPADVKRNEKFRNPAGVSMKLQNLRSLETHRGLQKLSEMDKKVWAAFGDKTEVVGKMAASIYAALKDAADGSQESPLEEQIGFAEGGVLTELHKRRERNPNLRHKLIAARGKNGPLACEICGWTCHLTMPEYQEAAFEGHHIRPLGMGSSTTTKVSDLALLCARCHRLVHRAIALEERWLTLVECGAILGY